MSRILYLLWWCCTSVAPNCMLAYLQPCVSSNVGTLSWGPQGAAAMQVKGLRGIFGGLVALITRPV